MARGLLWRMPHILPTPLGVAPSFPKSWPGVALPPLLGIITPFQVAQTCGGHS
jgi:hypothetical protein